MSCVTPLLLLEGKKVTTLERSGKDIRAGADPPRLHGEQRRNAATALPDDDAGAGVLQKNSKQPMKRFVSPKLQPNCADAGTQWSASGAVRRAARLMETRRASAGQQWEHTMNAPVIPDRRRVACRRRRGDRQLLI